MKKTAGLRAADDFGGAEEPSMRLCRLAAGGWDATVSEVAVDVAGLLAGSGGVS